MKLNITKLLGLVLPFLMWELNSKFALYHFFSPNVSENFFPSLNTIGVYLIDNIHISYINDMYITLYRTLIAFVISMFFGIGIALIASTRPFVNDIIYFPVEFFRNLPAVVLFPVLIVFLGIDSPMKISLAVFGAIFPIYIAAKNGFDNLSKDLIKTAKDYAWKDFEIMFKIMLPSAFPSIFSGLYIGMSISYILVIIGEMLIGSNGLGQRIVGLEREFNFSGLYAEIFIIGIIGYFLNKVINIVENFIIFWKE